LPNVQGLRDLLEKTLEPKDLIEQLPLDENLFVLTSGQALANSPKRLASAHMQHLMEKLHARFDLVIYDTPNLLDYTDASFLAANTDGILMVVTMGRTKQSLVEKARARIEKYGLPILGVVVNRVQTGDVE
jgi:Mrp family chromosome partitioning ATPase